MKFPSTYILLGILVFSVGCNQIEVSEENLLGTWKVVSFEAKTPDISPALMAKAEQEALSMSYQCLTDQRLWMNSIYYGDGQLASWILDPESRMFYVASHFEGQDVKEAYYIASLTPNTMEMHQQLEGIGTIELELKRE